MSLFEPSIVQIQAIMKSQMLAAKDPISVSLPNNNGLTFIDVLTSDSLTGRWFCCEPLVILAAPSLFKDTRHGTHATGHSYVSLGGNYLLLSPQYSHL